MSRIIATPEQITQIQYIHENRIRLNPVERFKLSYWKKPIQSYARWITDTLKGYTINGSAASFLSRLQ